MQIWRDWFCGSEQCSEQYTPEKAKKSKNVVTSLRCCLMSTAHAKRKEHKKRGKHRYNWNVHGMFCLAHLGPVCAGGLSALGKYYSTCVQPTIVNLTCVKKRKTPLNGGKYFKQQNDLNATQTNTKWGKYVVFSLPQGMGRKMHKKWLKFMRHRGAKQSSQKKHISSHGIQGESEGNRKQIWYRWADRGCSRLSAPDKARASQEEKNWSNAGTRRNPSQCKGPGWHADWSVSLFNRRNEYGITKWSVHSGGKCVWGIINETLLEFTAESVDRRATVAGNNWARKLWKSSQIFPNSVRKSNFSAQIN